MSGPLTGVAPDCATWAASWSWQTRRTAVSLASQTTSTRSPRRDRPANCGSVHSAFTVVVAHPPRRQAPSSATAASPPRCRNRRFAAITPSSPTARCFSAGNATYIRMAATAAAFFSSQGTGATLAASRVTGPFLSALNTTYSTIPTTAEVAIAGRPCGKTPGILIGRKPPS